MDTEELVENFEFLGDWEERYRYIIELGKLAPLEENERVEDNIVRGCQSQVWLVRDEDEANKLRFRADSDAFIVKALARCSLPTITVRAATFSHLMRRTFSIASAWTNTSAQAARTDCIQSFKNSQSRVKPDLVP